jgi:hypothetical protein
MLYLRSINRLILISLTLLGLSISSANAAPVAVVNPSFELAIGQPGGWGKYDPSGAGGGIGTYPPTVVNDAYNPPGPGGVPVPPDGDDIGWTFLSSEFGDDAGSGDPVGLQQELSSTLVANSHYELSVAVGNPQSFFSPRTLREWNMENFPGYIIQLLAGDTVIAEDLNSVSIDEGDFGIASLSLTVDNSHAALLGMALGIRLLNQNNDVAADYMNVPWAAAVEFDNVQLSVSAVPVPAAVWLFGSALVGLIGFSKRRKEA